MSVNDQIPEPPITPVGITRELFVPPFWLVTGLILLVVLTWIPLSMIALSRVSRSPRPRVHIFQDMDVQPRYEAQSPSRVFADGRGMRPEIPGTVARGELDGDDHYRRGYSLVERESGAGLEVRYHSGFPAAFEVSENSARRGRQLFNIYCAVCHGRDGNGNGPIHQRAMELEQAAWIPPSSLHSDTVRERKEGHLFNTITNGIRNMAGYGEQLDVADRWAVVLYIRALQRSQNATLEDVPPERRDQIR